MTATRDPSLTYTLWRSTELNELTWAPVSGANIVTATGALAIFTVVWLIYR